MNGMGRLMVSGFNHKALASLRQKMALTQEDLAIAVGVASPSISGWESGRTAPDPGNFARLVDVLGVERATLLNDVDELQGLAEYRKRAALSQPKAAETMGLSLAALRHVERGVRLPTPAEAEAIAQAYGITAREVQRLCTNLHQHRKARLP